MNETLYQMHMNSPLGKLYLVSSETGLRGIYWNKQDIMLKEHPILTQTKLQLDEYFLKKRTDFTIPLDPEGTPFQKSVWKALYKIPFGKTLSYLDIAKKIKNPKAIRAVGGANGKNPICIIIPCHRVINASGALGGYSGGLDIKKKLLRIEGHDFK